MANTFLVEGDDVNDDIQINHWRHRRDWPPHLHVQIELIYVRKGALTVSIDGQTQVLRQGDFGVAFPNCIHRYDPAEGVEELDVLFYLIKPHLMGGYADLIRTYTPRTPFLCKADLPMDARVALEMLRHQHHAIQPTVFKAYVEIVLACTWEQLHPESNANRNVDLPCQVLHYVMQHFSEPITLQTTANALGVTSNHLSRVFSQKLHMRFPQYLHFLRMQAARDMLLHTDKSVTTILYECGYDNPRTFNRVFAQTYGVSPRAYRQKKAR